MLEAGHALRVERDRQKELQSQLETQRQSVQKATVVRVSQHLFNLISCEHFVTLHTDPRSFA